VVNQQAEEIAALMTEARARTLELFNLAREEDLHESPGFGFRPIIWHLAHIGVFESYWLLQKLAGEPAPDERYERIFDPISTPREESRDLPSRREMEDYLSGVRERTRRVLEETRSAMGLSFTSSYSMNTSIRKRSATCCTSCLQLRNQDRRSTHRVLQSSRSKRQRCLRWFLFPQGLLRWAHMVTPSPTITNYRDTRAIFRRSR
jgi:hypothetical protein